MLRDVLILMMRHWCGIILLCQESEGPSTLFSLIESLNQPIHKMKKIIILESFIEVFNLSIMNLHLVLESTNQSDNL